MNNVVIIQKDISIYGVFSTWKAATDHFNKFIAPITVDEMKHLAETYQPRNIGWCLYRFRQFKVAKSYK